MDVACHNLVILLEKETEQYRLLLEISKREKRSLSAGNIDEFIAVTKDKEELLHKLQAADYERRTLMARLGKTFAIPSVTLSIGEIAARIPKADGKKISACREGISTLLVKIRRINQGNNALLMHATQFTQSSVRVLQQLFGESGVYQRNGQIGDTATSGTMLCNEI